MSEDFDLNLVSDDSVEIKKIPALAPKPAWLEFLLIFGTFGIYISFWLIRRTSELNRFNGSNFTPWLWFFVPLFPLFQVFALPKLVKELQQIQIKLHTPIWTAWSSAWYVLLIGLTVAFGISDKYAIPTWIIFIGFFINAGLYTVLTNQFSIIKYAHPQLELVQQKKSIRLFEIIISSLFSVIIFCLFSMLAYDGLKGMALEKYKSGDIYKNQILNFSVTAFGKGWSRVEPGTYSTDTSEAEFKGPNENMYFIVYSYDQDQSLATLTQNRIVDIKNYSNSADCSHSRHLNESQSGVIVKIVCKSSGYKELSVQTSTILETDDHVIELYGNFTSQPNTYKEYEQDFIKMALSLKEI